MANFDWSTEEEERWQDTPEQPTPRPGNGRWWRLISGVLVLLLLALLYNSLTRLNQYVSNREEQIKAEVETSYQLLQEAAVNQDLELLRLLLSGSDPRWGTDQELLARRGLLLDRPFRLWELTDTQHTIELSPDFIEATVTITQTYAVKKSEITLTRDVIFRRGDSRWLYAPPKESFWGESQTLRSTHLELTYPGRDAELAQELFTYLLGYLEEYCEWVNGRCQGRLAVSLYLDTSNNTLPYLFDFPQSYDRATSDPQTITLPTFSLVGAPDSPAGKQALFAYYAFFLIAGVNEWVMVEPRLGQEPFDRALLALQLQDLGLEPQLGLTDPLDPPYWSTLVDYEQLWPVVGLPIQESFSERALQVVQFLRTINPNTSPVAMQRSLSAGEFEQWLVAVTGREMDDLEREWLAYTYRQTSMYQPPPAGSLPQDVALLCQNNEELLVARYQSQQNGWQLEQLLGHPNPEAPLQLYALPADNGLIIERPSRDQSWYTQFLRPNTTPFVFDHTQFNGPLSYINMPTPLPQQLVLSAPHPISVSLEYYLLNVNKCHEEACPLDKLTGLPLWSPNGQQTLLMTRQGLYLGDKRGQEQERIGRGSMPFWLDDQTAGYVQALRQNNDGSVLTVAFDLVWVTLPGVEREITRFETVLSNFDPESSLIEPLFDPADLRLNHLVAVPFSNQLFLVASSHERQFFHLLVYDITQQQLRLLSSTNEQPGRLTFSPNGRWIMLTTFPKRDQTELFDRVSLILYDRQKEQIHSFSVSLPLGQDRRSWQADWSADGQWLLLTGNEYIELVQPDLNYGNRLLHPYEQCSFGQWLNEK